MAEAEDPQKRQAREAREERQDRKYLKQSAVRVGSGVRLVAGFAAVALAGYFFSVEWIWKLAGSIAVFFVGVTGIEYLNVVFIRRRLNRAKPQQP
jgi:hypothetical protein